MYDIIAAKARESTSTMIPDGSFDEESHWLDVQKDEHKLDFYAHLSERLNPMKTNEKLNREVKQRRRRRKKRLCPRI